jgi:hypothetical protein
MTNGLKVLDELGEQVARVALREAQPSSAPTRRRRRGLLVLVLLTMLVIAGVALAASGLLTGEPIRNPAGVALSPTSGLGTTVPASVKLTGLRVADPAGGPAWGMRSLRTTRGLGCLQIGRLDGNRLGVLGQDGAFANDGRFHLRPPTVLTQADCRPLDAAGQLFIAVSYQGMPASGLAAGCTAPDQPTPPASLSPKIATNRPPACPAPDERILYYGQVGPQAKSITYRNEAGRQVSTPVSGREGAYLVVLRSTARHPARGSFVPTASPGSGLTSVRYRDGSVCHIRSPRSIGGAKQCPLKGYFAPRTAAITATQLASPVHAHVARHTVLSPHSQQLPAAAHRNWKLTISFRARVAATAISYYIVTIRPHPGPGCQTSAMNGPVTSDIRRGEIVTRSYLLPARCHGTVHGAVTYHQQRGRPDQLPFTGLPNHDPQVGSYTAELPGS